MGITEIILLVLGILAFVASFVLPEKKAKLNAQDIKLGEEQMKELLEAQLKDVKVKVSEVTDETITYAVEKTERSLERVTNEKIMAVNEYSDTVLEAIHKNHEEVLFLYDMLNDKHDKLKDTAIEVEKKAKETLQKVKEEPVKTEVIKTEPVKAEPVKEPEAAGFVMLQPEAVEVAAINDKEKETISDKSDDVGNTEEKPAKKTTRKRTKAQPAIKNTERPEVDLSFASPGDDGRNNNEKILALHKAGKSNMAIAKELGLGIGEVKLVIDLFKGV